MLLTEAQRKDMLRQHAIAIPDGLLISEAPQITRWRGEFPVAVKVQVSSGGRGKAGGVLRANSAAEAEAAAHQLFGLRFGGEGAALRAAGVQVADNLSGLADAAGLPRSGSLTNNLMN